MKLYSLEIEGFFDSKYKSLYQKNNNWPDDLIEISDSKYNELTTGLSIGHKIGINGQGELYLEDLELLPELLLIEQTWQQAQINKVEAELLFYAQDQQIPEIYSELRRTHYTVDEYYALLGDRKLLSEFLLQDDFPECGRPTLSGLV